MIGLRASTWAIGVASGVLFAASAQAVVVETTATTVRSSAMEPTIAATRPAVSLQEIAAGGGEVSGVVVNTSTRPILDVQLLVRRNWLWNDEFHPGLDNPGSSAFYTVRALVPPGGSVPFEIPTGAGEFRSDGRFQTTVDVVGFTEISFPVVAIR